MDIKMDIQFLTNLSVGKCRKEIIYSQPLLETYTYLTYYIKPKGKKQVD